MIKKLFCLFLIICFLFISTGCTRVESVKFESTGSQLVLVETLHDPYGTIRIYRDVKTGVEYIKSGSTSLVVRINADGTPYIEEESDE